MSSLVSSLKKKWRVVMTLIAAALVGSCSKTSNHGGEITPIPTARAPVLSAVQVEGLNVEIQPLFDPTIKHYAIQCGDGDPFSISIETENVDQILFNSTLSDDRSFDFENLSIEDDITLHITNEFATDKYYFHCTSADLPTFVIDEKSNKVDDGFLIVAPRFDSNRQTYLAIIDNNGVPRFRRRLIGTATDFKRHPDGRYSYAYRYGYTEFDKPDYEIVILDEQFEEQKRLSTIGLSATDNHDFLITEQGNYLLLSYAPAYRDLSNWGLSANELTRDSVIQEQTPEGEVVFEWNSWDAVDIESCLIHRFPDDYAHINSVFVTPDNNIVASLRGCSMILKLDRKTGATIWKLGGFNSDLEIVGDPYEEFCGQHSATMRDETLLLFDNGGPCNGAREAVYGQFSRVVSYSIDEPAAQAKFIDEYSYNNEYAGYTRSGGSVFTTRNGNWLISWSRDVQDITEVTPEKNVAIRIKIFEGENQIRAYRAFREYDLKLPISIEGDVTYPRFSN